MQKRMKEYLNELKKQQQRRRKTAIAAVLLVVLVVGMVANGLTGSGAATTGEGLEEQLENSYDDLEQVSEMSLSDDELVEIVEEEPADEPAEIEIENPAEFETGTPDGNPDNAGDTEETDGNPDNAGDAEETDGNPDNAGDTEETDGNPDNAGDIEETDGNPDNAGDIEETDGNPDNVSDTEETDGNPNNVTNTEVTDENPNSVANTEVTDGDQSGVTDLKLFDTEEDEEEDLGDLPTIEEMDNVPGDRTLATMQKARALRWPGRTNESEEIEEDSNENWDFSVYYQPDKENTDVTITDNTSVKYQMEFHTDVALAPGKVEIRIPYNLLFDRNECPVEPTEIAVPRSPSNSDKESVYNKNTPFNYYIEDSELVFFNYRRITAGTNAAWQVLFKNLQIMELKDGNKWNLQAVARVTKPEYKYDGTGKPVTTEQKEKKSPAPLTGKVDSSVTLVKVTKTEYKEPNKKYTPGLYTKAQVENYIAGELPEKYAEDFNNWKFVVWEVTMEGSATQPWDLVLSEALTAGEKSTGEIVGYRNHTNSTWFFDINEDRMFEETDSANLEATVVENSWETYFRSRFYVVTAYPRDDVKEGDRLENTLTVKMVPVDTAAKTQSQESHAVWEYENYIWRYSGDMIGIDKVSNTISPYDEKDYDSWLEAYSKAMDAGEDYGSLWFASTGSFKGYGNTHVVPVKKETGEGETVEEGTVEDETGTIGSYREGTGYELTTVDDFMYARPSGTGIPGRMIMLDWKDYYYSEVKVTQTDYAYDFLEDNETSNLERKAEGVRLYAMYAKPGEEGKAWTDADRKTWEPVNGGDPVALDSSTSKAFYTFSPEELAREPWRVKAVHETTEYKTECRIDVNVRLRAEPSEGLKQIMEDYKKDLVSFVKLEDLSGVLGRTFTTGAGGKREYTICETENGNNYDPYEGLEKATLKLYKNEYEDQERTTSIQRDNASVTVYGLRKEADAFKTYRTTNDVANSRAMVDYCLTAYDSYKVHEESAVNYLKSMGVPTPGKNHVMFYDLLPVGMYFDPSRPVFVGRITELDRNGYYKSRTNYWDDAQVVLSDTEVVDNWKGTGRTMLIFHIDYTGADPAVYTDGKWLEGWGVSFRAYYEWKDKESVQKQYNISAFMPDVAKYDDPAVELLGEYGKVYRDGEIQSLSDNAYADFKKEGGLNDANTADVANVLYAKCQAKENLATASKATIEKLVRADSDIFSVYDDSAYAEEGEGYTYKITVETKDGGLTDLVVFDHLEHASVERAGITTDPNQSRFSDSSEELWHGTFRGVQLSGLTAKGVKPVVWYNTARNAATTGTMPEDGLSEGMTWREEEVSPDAVLKSENGWYQEAGLIQKYKAAHSEDINKTDAEIKELAFAEVKSIAVDLRKAAGAEDNGSFVLMKDDSVSFLVRMRAPETENEESEEDPPKDRYAYNNPSYYSRSVTNEGGTTQSGESVRVRLGSRYTLEVIKELEGDAPGSFKDQAFTFRAYRLEQEAAEGEDGETSESKVAPLSNKEYTLWKKAENTESGWKRLPGGPYATDADGFFSLKAGQKAVFANVSNAKDVTIEETESLFWNTSDMMTTERDEAKGTVTYTHTVKNQYRYVLYVHKKTEGVPEGVTLSDKEKTFIFQIKLDGKQQTLDYCRVDGARLDGVSPKLIPFDDGETIRKTNSDGTFEIQEGWTLALFLPEADTAYELTELYEKDGTPLSENWLENGSVSGTGSAYGKSVVITNRYKWKDLDLTKKITHQEAEDCQETFTFQISKWAEDANSPTGGRWVPVNTQNDWVMLDPESEGQEAFDEGAGADEDEDEPSDAGRGKLDENGTFSVPCAGRTIRIKNLEAGAKYQIKEIQIPGNYQSGYLDNEGSFVQSDTVEVTMPVFSESKKAEIINDYLLRPLSVTKTVVSNEMTDDTSFRMILKKKIGSDYNVLGSQPYTVKETGEQKTTDADGVFSLQAGQTAVFESLGKAGEEFVIWEIQDHEKYPQIYPAGENSNSRIGSESVKLGEPVEAVLTDAGADRQFINGSPEYMLLSKEYEGRDSGGVDLVYDKLKKYWVEEAKPHIEGVMAEANYLKEMMEKPENKGDNFDSVWKTLYELRDQIEQELSLRWNENTDYDVRVQLTSGQENWSLETPEHPIICIDQLMGRVYELSFDSSDGWTIWYYDEIGDRDVSELPVKRRLNDCDAEALLAYQDGSFNIKPWMTYVIYMGKGVSYTVTEEDPYEYRPDTGYVISQKIPEPGDSLTGVTGETSAAVLHNEIKTFGANIQKKMTPDSDPVSVGKDLVWCVQRYNESTKRWEAAEGIEYIVLEGDVDGIYDLLGSIQTTKADGKIRLNRSKDQNTYLSVQFFQSDGWVYLNMESAVPGALRVIELLEESDPAWGRLAGYGCPDMGDRYGMDVSESASIIYNSNRTMQVEIEKQTKEQVNETFTMFLKEMMTDLTGLEGAQLYQPRSGIAYTVYDSETDQEAGSGTTGINGEIQMMDGQYVRLSLPSETIWAVSEDEDAVPNFELTDLKGEKDNSNILSKKDENLMLIGTLREGTTCITQADVWNGVIDADTGERVFLSEDDVIIPQYILQGNTRYEVTGIDKYAFHSQFNLTSVTIPDSVTYIGESAFADCESLTSVTIPNGITRIEDYTFAWSGLTSITIPDSVTTIGNFAFYLCEVLTSAKIPESVERIGENAFGCCKYMTQADIPEGVQSIGECAFTATGLTKATIPASVTDLGDSVFAHCTKLEDVAVKCNIDCIPSGMFYQCFSLKKVKITGDVKCIGNGAFNGLTNLELAELPYALQTIDEYAFGNCSSLTSLNIPESVTAIGQYAFSGSGLTEIMIPKNVTSVGYGVFKDCTKLRKATFECTIDSISKGMFEGCSDLTIIVNGTIQEIGSRAFYNCTSLKQFIVTESGSVPDIKDNAFMLCTSLETVELGNGSVSIGIMAFTGCSHLTRVDFPEDPTSIVKIGYSAFGRTGLTAVKIPASVRELGYGAFNENTELKSAVIACDMKEKATFQNCTALNNVEFQEGLTTIGNYTFYNCTSLTQITFPASLKSIGDSAFENCSQLATVNHQSENLIMIGENAFKGTPYKEGEASEMLTP